MSAKEKAISTIVLVAVLVGIGYGVRASYRAYSKWSFGREITAYDERTQREAAYVAFSLARPHLPAWEVAMYERRLAEEQHEDEHAMANAIAVFSDPSKLDRLAADSFSSILADLMQRFTDRTTPPGKEIFELWDVQARAGRASWYYAVEGFENPDGTVCEVTYDEYVGYEREFRPLQAQMDALLAQHQP